MPSLDNDSISTFPNLELLKKIFHDNPQGDWIQGAVNRRNFHSLILISLGGLTFSLTLSAYHYQDHSTRYLECIDPSHDSQSILGEENLDLYKYLQTDLYFLVWTLPFYHPFHFLSVLTFNSSIVLVKNISK